VKDYLFWFDMPGEHIAGIVVTGPHQLLCRILQKRNIAAQLRHRNSWSVAFEQFEDAEAIDNERRKTIAKSIRIISVEVLKKLGEEIFDEPDRPWRQTFLEFIAQHPGATFHHASAGEGVVFLYSRDGDKGLWYLPGSGIGPLSDGGGQLMNEAIAAGH
jgi:hypothetical protein